MGQANKPLRAAVYVRISKDASGQGLGVERQEHDCRALAERLRVPVVEVFQDNDIGASNLSRKARPGYERMLEAVRDGRIDTIIAYSYSRLTRRPKEWLELIELASPPTDLQIHTCVSGDHNLTTADGRAVALTIAVWDAAEAERLSERTKAAYAAMARKGTPLRIGSRPFGWKKNRVDLEPGEADLIREAVADLRNGTQLTAIANSWNSLGVATPKGNEWTYSSVQKVLTNPRIAGIRTHDREIVLDPDGKPVRGQWEPIITPEEHHLMLVAYRRRKKTRRAQVKHMLSPLLVCGRCRGRMSGNFLDGGRTTYTCRRGHLGINARRLEEHVRVMCGVQLILWNDWSATHSEQVEEESRGEWEHQEQLEELNADIAAMMADYYESPRTRKALLSQVDLMREELEELEERKARWLVENETPTPPIEYPVGFLDMDSWMSMTDTPDAWLELTLHSAIREIMIRPTVRGRRNMRERVEIFWTPRFEPWGEAEPDLPEAVAEWLHRYFSQVNPPSSRSQEAVGSRSGSMAAIIAKLGEQPEIAVKDMAAHVGLSARHTNRLMLYAKRRLAEGGEFQPDEGPTKQADSKFMAVAEMLRANPDTFTNDVADALGISTSYASTLKRKVKEVLAEDPDHDFSKTRPTSRISRKGSTKIPRVLEILKDQPDITGKRLAELLGVGEKYGQLLLRDAKELRDAPEPQE